MSSFGKRLRMLLAERGWTQRRLSTSTGIDKSEISRYCKGATRPKLGNLKKIADALGLGIVALEPQLDVSALPAAPSEPGESINSPGAASSSLELKIFELVRSMRPPEQLELLVHIAKSYGPESRLEPPSDGKP
jgi:transcriptional regulator with XRE-family HTH domain